MTVFGLASFTQRNCFEIHPYCWASPQLVSFYCGGVLHCGYHVWFIRSPMDGHLGRFGLALVKIVVSYLIIALKPMISLISGGGAGCVVLFSAFDRRGN